MRRAAIEKGLHVEKRIFHLKQRSKDNKINTKSTNISNPTKGLDKVEALLAESIIQFKTLESNKSTITNRIEDNIGHFAHKNTSFGNIMPHSLQDN